MLRSLPVLAAVVATAASSFTPASAAGYGPGVDAFAFVDDRISESSGVVASSRQDGIWYTHNDSGHPAQVFTVDDHGCTLEVVHLTDGAGSPLAVTDIEDIARGPANGESMLWLGDIGDNLHERQNGIAVYRVPEPPANASATRATGTCPTTTNRTEAPRVFRLAYPDQPQDAETLLADPESGRLFVVTKVPAHHSLVYAAPHPLNPDAVNVLELVGAIAFPPSTTYDRDAATEVQALLGGSTQAGFDLTGRVWAVGGDVAPAGDRVVVRTYTDAWEWSVPEGGTLVDAFAGIPLQVPLAYERQGEAIAYARDGRSLLTTCEDVGCVAHRYEG